MTVSIIQFHPYFTLAYSLDIHLQYTVSVVVHQIRCDTDILNMVLGVATIQVAITSHTTQSPEVLILTPGAIAPTEHLEGDEVLARMHIFSDIKLSCNLCILTVSHELSVYPKVDTRGDAAEMGNHLLSFPGCWKCDGLTI